MVRGGSAFTVLISVLGSYTAQFDVRLPAFHIVLGYSTTTAQWAAPKIPRYSVTVGYEAALLPQTSHLPSLTLGLHYSEKVFGPLLDKSGAPRSARFASLMAPREPDLTSKTQEPPQNPPAAVPAPNPETAASVTPGIATDKTVTLEVARIAPGGVSVFAGRAAPGAQITVFENQTQAGTATAGPDGEWSLATEYKFATNSASISVRTENAAPVAPPNDAPATTPKDNVVAMRPAEEPPIAPGSPAANLIKEFEDTVATAREAAGSEPHAPKPADVAAPAPPKDIQDETASHVPNAPHVEKPQPAAQDSAELKPAAVPVPQNIEPAAEIAETAQAAAATAPRPQPQTTIIPIPMRFHYREATLTSDGRQAVALLLEYLKLKKLSAVALSGHADERGTDSYNMKLSRKRLKAIEELLREGGYGGKLDLLPRGESEPYQGVDRTRFEREDLMQLDRRVELRIAQ